MYRNAVRGGSSHGDRQRKQKLNFVLVVFELRERTEKDKQTNTLQHLAPLLGATQ